jgi:hypothetical protein
VANLVDLTGQKFGRLTALYRLENNRWGATVWLCLCDCGVEKPVSSNALRRGLTRSCWCLRREASRGRKILPPGEAAKNHVLLRYKLNATRRGLGWNLTDEEFFVLTSKNCRYCGCAPAAVKALKSGSYVYNGLDRADSNLGYSCSNVVPCCSQCNYAKRHLSQQEFAAWVLKISAHLSINPLE